MTSSKFKKASLILKVFANAKRLEILSLLKNRELNVRELVNNMKYRQSNVSQHLMILKNAGILIARRDGKNMYYRRSTRTFGEIPDTIMKEQQKS